MATLDQLEGSVDFLPKTEKEEVAVFGGEKEEAQPSIHEQKLTLDEIRLHDTNGMIANVCKNIDNLLKDIVKEYPDLQKYDNHIVD